MSKQRVCIIGAGPSGMSVLYHYNQLETDNKPDVVCYDKQAEWGGLWNYSWKTGTDEFGELCHHAMYRGLWINLPKECMELPQYTLKEHYGKPIPAFLPRAVMRDYMEGLWNKPGNNILFNYVQFNHAVRFVKYNEETDNFTVTVADLKGQTTKEETFSHVVVSSGNFPAPNKPEFPGMDCFKGRIIHSKDFRNAEEFKGQRVLVIGGSDSAWDISIHLIKAGANRVVVSHRRSSPITQTWPEGITEYPLVSKIYEWSASFKDETSADFDAIILCTGFNYSFPFLEHQLQLTGRTSFYPGNLYKGVIWMSGGNNKLFYMSPQMPMFTLPLIDMQAKFVCKYITNQLTGEPKSTKDMTADVEKSTKKFADTKSLEDMMDFHVDYSNDLIDMIKSTHNMNGYRDILVSILGKMRVKIDSGRDTSCASVYTGQVSTLTKPFMENNDETID